MCPVAVGHVWFAFTTCPRGGGRHSTITTTLLATSSHTVAQSAGEKKPTPDLFLPQSLPLDCFGSPRFDTRRETCRADPRTRPQHIGASAITLVSPSSPLSFYLAQQTRPARSRIRTTSKTTDFWKDAVKERNRAGKHRSHAASFHVSKGFPLSTLPVSILFRAVHRFPVRQKEVDVSEAGRCNIVRLGRRGVPFSVKGRAHSSTTPASPFSRHD